jgi:hypothetical protein
MTDINLLYKKIDAELSRLNKFYLDDNDSGDGIGLYTGLAGIVF